MVKYCYFAQPIETIRERHIIMYELLLREFDEVNHVWKTPASFEISDTLMLSLLTQARQKLGDSALSLNLTLRQFASKRTATALVNYAHHYLAPRQLTIELVKAPSLALMQRMGAIYRSAGILIAMDDVGSDNFYEEVAPLLPYLNTIKFALHNMRRDANELSPQNAEALKFWFDQSEDKQLLFTFEGIENQDDIELAMKLGITRGQGYFFSRPRQPK